MTTPSRSPRPLHTPLSDLDARYRCELLATATGDVAVGTWAGDTPPVLALHGISSNHLLWSWAAAAAPDVTIVAPDLRGRGLSRGEGPYGLARHRDDVLATADALGLDRFALAGMSMGGFVATAVAAAAPDRVDRVLLVDGGIPFDLRASATSAPAAADVDARGAVTERFATVEAYAATYFAAMGQDLDRSDPLLLASMAHNLQGEPGDLRVRLPAEALRTDAADTFGHAPVAEWLRAVQAPVHVVHAHPPALPMDVAGWAEELPAMTHRPVDGVDHATIVMGPRGGRLVGDALRDLTAPAAAAASAAG